MLFVNINLYAKIIYCIIALNAIHASGKIKSSIAAMMVWHEIYTMLQQHCCRSRQ